MADEQPPKPEQDGEKKGGGIFKLAIVAVFIVVPLIVALATYRLVVQPALAEDEPDITAAAGDESYASVVNYEFEQGMASIIPENPEWPASQLIYQIGFECANPETVAIIEQHRNRFQSLIHDKHLYHHREEMNERVLRDSIQEQIKIEANALLRRYQDEPNPTVRILDVYHIQWMVHD